jgi:hypothetical protein
LIALELNYNEIKDDTLLLDENFNLKGFKSFKKQSTLENQLNSEIVNFDANLKKIEVHPKLHEGNESIPYEKPNFKSIVIPNKKTYSNETENNGKSPTNEAKKAIRIESLKKSGPNTPNDKKNGVKKIKKFLLNSTNNENIESTVI